MRLDFWNNPLVVTALRQKYRGGALAALTATHVTALITLGGVIRYYSGPQKPWIFYYFVAVMVVQFGLSAIGSVVTTSTSILTEVTGNTMDAQRLATLSPRQIMIGKLIGPPATAHFLAQCTVPIALWCCFMGGLSLSVLALLYVQIFTISFLFGSLGLLTPTEISAKRSGPAVVLAAPLSIMLIVFSANPMLPRIPGIGLFLGLFLPTETFRAIIAHAPWRTGLLFYQFDIPFLIAAPAGQLALGCLLFNAATRKLANVQNPPISKPLAYAVLVILDLLIAGNVFDSTFAQFDIRSAALFCLAHLIASMVLILALTPGRESLLSWAWRFRGRMPVVLDSAVGERSDNSMVVAIFSLLTPLMLMLLVWLPLRLDGRAQAFDVAAANVAPVVLTTMLLVAALGVMYQWFVLIAAKPGRIFYFLFVLLLVAVPPLLAQLPRSADLRNLSPAIHFTAWFGGHFERAAGPLRLSPMVTVYGTLLVAAWISKQRRMRRQIQRIDGTFGRMGVPQASRPGSVAANR